MSMLTGMGPGSHRDDTGITTKVTGSSGIPSQIFCRATAVYKEAILIIANFQ